MAVRIRSRFARAGRDRTMPELASVAAMLGWKLAQDAIRRMREARFDIDAGRCYFDFVCEYLAFLLHAADRIAYRELDAGRRGEFTTALALRLADLVEDNRAMLLAPVAAGQCRRHFIDLANAAGADYGAFDYDDRDGPDFGFRRCLGHRMTEVLPEKDRAWVVDHVMEIEVPEAAKALERTFAGLFAPPGAPRRRPAETMGD
jgi:hypothetical protein